VDVGANAVLAPISWELIEPREGVFDLHLVDEVLDGPRSRRLKLVPLWFGSWKNGSSSYTPLWVKLDPDRSRCRRRRRSPVRQPQPFSDANQEADATAFAALMRRLRPVDHDGTVIMVQVENEVGLLGAARLFSPDAVRAWSSHVPQPLLAELRRGASSARPKSSRNRCGTSWPATRIVSPNVYGLALRERCRAGAAAGVAEFDVPAFVNAWLDASVPDPDPDWPLIADGQRPGEYPSGGPLPHVAVAWKVAAPTVGFTSPDI
jgi:hypothetical protein